MKMESKKHVFSPAERRNFFEILKKYSNVIENRSTDGVSLRKKNEAWIRVTAEFNGSPLARKQRTAKQLRRLWINTKQRQREAMRKERQYRLAAVTAPALIVGIDNVIDPDTVKDPLKTELPESIEIEDKSIIVEPNASNNSIASQEQTTADPIVPQFPISSKRESPPRSFNTRSVLLKTNIMEQEYNDRYARANEKHKLEMDILREQLREAKSKADLAELILKEKLNSIVLLKNNIMEQEYKDRYARANEKHKLEMDILREQLREAKAKADLAELTLKEKLNSTGHSHSGNYHLEQ